MQRIPRVELPPSPENPPQRQRSPQIQQRQRSPLPQRSPVPQQRQRSPLPQRSPVPQQRQPSPQVNVQPHAAAAMLPVAVLADSPLGEPQQGRQRSPQPPPQEFDRVLTAAEQQAVDESGRMRAAAADDSANFGDGVMGHVSALADHIRRDAPPRNALEVLRKGPTHPEHKEMVKTLTLMMEKQRAEPEEQLEIIGKMGKVVQHRVPGPALPAAADNADAAAEVAGGAAAAAVAAQPAAAVPPPAAPAQDAAAAPAPPPAAQDAAAAPPAAEGAPAAAPAQDAAAAPAAPAAAAPAAAPAPPQPERISVCAMCGMINMNWNCNRGGKRKHYWFRLGDDPHRNKMLKAVKVTDVVNEHVDKLEAKFGERVLHRHNGNRVGLYAAHVTDSGHFRLCDTCYGCMQRGSVHRYSLAGNFLLAVHPKMKSLWPLERNIVSMARMYGAVYKLKKNAQQSALKGHVCHFKHEAPIDFADHFLNGCDMSKVWVRDMMHIKLVGDEKDLKAFLESAHAEQNRIKQYEDLLLAAQRRAAEAAAAAGGDAPPLPPEQLPPRPYIVQRKLQRRPVPSEHQPFLIRPSVVISVMQALKEMDAESFDKVVFTEETIAKMREKLFSECKQIIAATELLNEEGQAAAELDNTDVAHVRSECGGYDSSFISTRTVAEASPAEVIGAIAKITKCAERDYIRVHGAAALRAVSRRLARSTPPQPTPSRQAQSSTDSAPPPPTASRQAPSSNDSGLPKPTPSRSTARRAQSLSSLADADAASPNPAAPPGTSRALYTGAAAGDSLRGASDSVGPPPPPSPAPPEAQDHDEYDSVGSESSDDEADDDGPCTYADLSDPKEMALYWSFFGAEIARDMAEHIAADAQITDKEVIANLQKILAKARPDTIICGRSDELEPDYRPTVGSLKRTWPDLFAFCLLGESDTRVNNNGFNRALIASALGTFASCHEFILATANQRQRGQTAAAATYAIKMRQSHQTAFLNIVRAPDFQKKATAAVKDPHSVEAKRLWSQLSPTIRVSGARVLGSPEERSSALSQMYALSMAYGVPSLFVTVSPDDTNHSFVLRLHRFLRESDAARYVDALAHPDKIAQATEQVLDGDTEVAYEWVHPFDDETWARLHHARSANAALTSGIAALNFVDVIDAFCEIALGIRRNAGGALNTTPTKGLFGYCKAWHGVYECQGKGTLHMHALIWGGLRPEMLELANHDDKLREVASTVLDSYVCARAGPHAPETYQPASVRCRPEHTCEREFVVPHLPTCVCQTHDLLSPLVDAYKARKAQQQPQPQQQPAARPPAAPPPAAPPAAAPPPPAAPAPATPAPAAAAVAADAAAPAQPEQLPIGEEHIKMLEEFAKAKAGDKVSARLFIDLLMWCPCSAHASLRWRIKCYQVHCHSFTCFKKGCLCRMGMPTSAPTETRPMELLMKLVDVIDDRRPRRPGEKRRPALHNAVANVARQLLRNSLSPQQQRPAAAAADADDDDVPAQLDYVMDDDGEYRPLREDADDNGDAAEEQKKPVRQVPRMTGNGAFYDPEVVAVEEAGTRYTKEELAKRRRKEPHSRREDPMVRLKIDRESRVIVWTLRRDAGDFDVCPFSVAMLAMFGCNCAILPLGSKESAIAAAFYNANYMVKDGLKLEHALPVMRDAAARAVKYKSRAQDADTQNRQDNFLLQLSLNSIHALCEMPVTMAGAIALGRPTHDSSHRFSWIFPVHGLVQVQRFFGPPPPSAAIATEPSIGGDGGRGNGRGRGRANRDAFREDFDSASSSDALSDEGDLADDDDDDDDNNNNAGPPSMPSPLPRNVVDDPFALSAAKPAAAGHQGAQKSLSTTSSMAVTELGTASANSQSSVDTLLGFSGSGPGVMALHRRQRRENGGGGEGGVDDDAASNDGDVDVLAALLGIDKISTGTGHVALVSDPEGISRTTDAPSTVVMTNRGELQTSDLISAYAHRGVAGKAMLEALLSGSEHIFAGRADHRQLMLDALGNMTLWEFVALIDWNCKRPDKEKKKKERANADDGAAAAAGGDDDDDDDDDIEEADDEDPFAAAADGAAPAAGTVTAELKPPPRCHFFDKRYSGYDTRMMRLQTQFRMPRFAGRVINQISARSSPAQLDKVAGYLGVLFTPWSVDFPPAVRNFDQLEVWFKGLDVSRPRQAMLHSIVQNMLTYSSTRFTRQMLTSYRMLHAASKYLRNLNFQPGRVGANAEEQAIIDVDAVRAANKRRAVNHTVLPEHVKHAIAALRSADGNIRDAVTSTRVFEPEEPHLQTALDRLRAGTLPENHAHLYHKLSATADSTELQRVFDVVFAMRNEDDRCAQDARVGGARAVGLNASDEIRRHAEAALRRQQEARGRQLEQMVEQLNPDQRREYDRLTELLAPRMSVAAGARVPADTRAVLYSLSGGAGVGKSLLVRTLTTWALFEHQQRAAGLRRADDDRPLEDRKPLLAAYTGIAASLIDGLTLHRAFKLFKSDISIEERATLRRRLEQAPFIVVDEISMVGCAFFSKLIARIEEIFTDPVTPANSIRFGSPDFPPLILVGDFAQLACVKDVPLYTQMTALVKDTGGTAADREALTQELKQRRKPKPAAAAAAAAAAVVPATKCHSVWAQRVRGRYFFSEFECGKLEIQMRAECPQQRKLVEHMRTTGTMPDVFNPDSDVFVSDLSGSSPAADIRLFRWAPIVTSRNSDRAAYNFAQAQSFAAAHGVPLIIWKKVIADAAMSEAVLAGHEDPSSDFYGSFVAGAPAMILANVVPHLSISNGSSGYMHSLTWHDEAEGRAMRNRILCAGPGQIVEVSPPAFLNVTIMSKHVLPLTSVPVPDISPLIRELKNDEHAYLLPMHGDWRVDAKRDYCGTVLMPSHTAHRVDLGFSFTFHKVQGATLPRVILDFNFRRPCDASFASAFVGLTRARKIADIRVLPIVKGSMKQCVEQLKVSEELQRWFREAGVAQGQAPAGAAAVAAHAAPEAPAPKPAGKAKAPAPKVAAVKVAPKPAAPKPGGKTDKKAGTRRKRKDNESDDSE